MFRQINKPARTILDIIVQLPHAARVAYDVEVGRKPRQADLDALHIRRSFD